LKQRIREYKSSIRRKDVNYPVVAHFLALNYDVFVGLKKWVCHQEGADFYPRLFFFKF